MIERARPAIVRITTERSVGTGAIFEQGGGFGYVVTNEHVIEGFQRVTVRVNDRRDYDGEVMGFDPDMDVAVVRIYGGPFDTLSFGEPVGAAIGQQVVSIGYPLFIPGAATVTTGIISAIRYDAAHKVQVIQSDAAINPGNSGGPMLDMRGRIVGINTYKWFLGVSEGLGFALMGSAVAQRVANLKEPIPPAPGMLIGPVDGWLRHDTSNGLSRRYYNLDHKDIGVEANFVNPYALSVGKWSHGFLVRDTLDEFLMVCLSSGGNWQVSLWSSYAGWETIEWGYVSEFSHLNTGASEQNILKVLVQGNSITLFVNGRRRWGDIDVSEHVSAGAVSAASGLFTGTGVAGEYTRFEDFRVWEL